MKNQKNFRRQLQFEIGQLAPGAGLNQILPLTMPKAFAPARKIPVVYHFKIEESVSIKQIAPALAA
jgi:hypothetical protein